MDHYKQAKNLLDAGLMQPAIAHALLAIVDVLRDDERDESPPGFRVDPAVLAEFLRPIKDLDIKGDVL